MKKIYFSVIFFSFSYYLYFLSLEKSENRIDICALKINGLKVN